jgi:hypothetical protein
MQLGPKYSYTSTVARTAVACALLAVIQAVALSARGAVLQTLDGFHGIWYAVGPSDDQYAYKYSGGLGTYTHQTAPLAVYSPKVDRTYFVYGGTNGLDNELKNCIAYYDHKSGMLARPRQVRNVGGNDNHQNITLTIDNDGYLYVFANSHGDAGTGNLYKSSQPFSIAEFDEIALPAEVFQNTASKPKVVLSYSNPFYVPGSGLLVVYNQYHDGRAVHVATSRDAHSWIDRAVLDTNEGHYTVARQNGHTIGVMADFHRNGSLDHRTNLYYLQTKDFGTTWTSAAGARLSTPLTTRNNPALVHDYFAENKLVYMKDIDFDTAGNPILLFLTVSDADEQGHLSGPHPGGRVLHTARWTGREWQIRDMITTDHNYDHGELWVESDGTWRVTGVFLDGPQHYGTGGEVGVWTSRDQGGSWQLFQQLTRNSQFNHTYVRYPVNARDDFFAFWADGNAFAPSASRLYFATKQGDVYRMPVRFAGDFAAPEPASQVVGSQQSHRSSSGKFLGNAK